MKRLNLLAGGIFGLTGLVSVLSAHWLQAAIWGVLGLGMALSDLSYAATGPAAVATAVPLPPVRKTVSIFLVVVALLLMGYQIGQDLKARAARHATTAVRP